jgi:hypothetical protein
MNEMLSELSELRVPGESHEADKDPEEKAALAARPAQDDRRPALTGGIDVFLAAGDVEGGIARPQPERVDRDRRVDRLPTPDGSVHLHEG